MGSFKIVFLFFLLIATVTSTGHLSLALPHIPFFTFGGGSAGSGTASGSASGSSSAGNGTGHVTVGSSVTIPGYSGNGSNTGEVSAWGDAGAAGENVTVAVEATGITNVTNNGRFHFPKTGSGSGSEFGYGSAPSSVLIGRIGRFFLPM